MPRSRPVRGPGVATETRGRDIAKVAGDVHHLVVAVEHPHHASGLFCFGLQRRKQLEYLRLLIAAVELDPRSARPPWCRRSNRPCRRWRRQRGARLERPRRRHGCRRRRRRARGPGIDTTYRRGGGCRRARLGWGYRLPSAIGVHPQSPSSGKATEVMLNSVGRPAIGNASLNDRPLIGDSRLGLQEGRKDARGFLFGENPKKSSDLLVKSVSDSRPLI